MGLFMAHQMPVCTEYNMIPDQQLLDILKVYEFCKREDISKLPNDLICRRGGDFWTTWNKVFNMRDSIQKQKHDDTWSISCISPKQRENDE